MTSLRGVKLYAWALSLTGLSSRGGLSTSSDWSGVSVLICGACGGVEHAKPMVSASGSPEVDMRSIDISGLAGNCFSNPGAVGDGTL